MKHPLSPRTLQRAAQTFALLISPHMLLTPLVAQERAATDAPRGERAANPGAPRGQRPAGERNSAPRSEFPAEIKLTDEQQSKLNEINTAVRTRQEEIAQKRNSILTDEQKAAQAEVFKKVREGGLSRQEVADQVASALKLTPEQKTQIEGIDTGSRKQFQEINEQKMAVLTEEQRGILRKARLTAESSRRFTIPGGIETTPAQQASLKALQEELAPSLTELNEKLSALLTDERRAAREAAFKEARESGKDRQALAEAVDAALKLSPAEKTQLAETEQSLRELNEKIRTRIEAVLTPEQKAELEKRFGGRR